MLNHCWNHILKTAARDFTLTCAVDNLSRTVNVRSFGDAKRLSRLKFNEEFLSFSSNLSENFSVIHLNIRRLRKNIDKLKDFLNDIKEKFRAIVLSGTQIDDDKADLNSLFHIPNYSFIHEKRKTDHKAGD